MLAKVNPTWSKAAYRLSQRVVDMLLAWTGVGRLRFVVTQIPDR